MPRPVGWCRYLGTFCWRPDWGVSPHRELRRKYGRPKLMLPLAMRGHTFCMKVHVDERTRVKSRRHRSCRCHEKETGDCSSDEEAALRVGLDHK